MQSITIRDPAKDDIERSFDVRNRSFGPLPEGAGPGWHAGVEKAIDEGRTLAAYDGDLLVARALIWPFRQFWGGRVLAMAGIAGVVVAPEYRGRGVGSALMQGMVERGRDLGYPVSALYPATVPVYRQNGWEIAGVQHRTSIKARLLRDLRTTAETPDVREVGPSDAEHLLAIMREQYAAGRVNGVRDHDADEFAEELAAETVFAYAMHDGFVVYGWEDRDIVVYQLVAGSPASARNLWSVVGSSSSIVDTVHAYLAPDDPIHQILGETVLRDVRQERWMLRVLDVEAALSGRGYPPATDTQVGLVVDDPLLPGGGVTGRLFVSGGTGTFVPDEGVRSDDAAVRLGPNGLAALYAGTPTATLLTAGLVAGGTAESRDQLDSVFAGRPAYLLEYF
ncbi:MAG TPA: GNAT family N-acetyltransferase [Nocardioidaceae bacterium]